MWNIYIAPECDKPMIRYVIKTLVHHIGVNPLDQQLSVYIGMQPKTSENRICLVFDRVFLKEETNNNTLEYDYELLEKIGDSLTLRYEQGAALDKNGRVRYTSLDPSIQKVLSEQFVDFFVDKVRHELIRLLKAESILYDASTPWMEKTIVLSHDVDDLYGKSWIRYAFWLTKGIKRFSSEIKRIKWWVNQKSDPYFSPIEMCEIEGRYGFKSSFYFMAKSSYLSFDEGRRYNVKSKKVRLLISAVEKLGWEVGFHPSRKTFDNFRNLKKEYKRLSQSRADITGVRRHYLKGQYPQVWRDLEKLQIKYDTSVGWPDRYGARSGTCRPFKAFDFIEDKELNIYEMPLTFMDGTLQYENAESYLSDYYDIENRLLASGVMTFLWHTDRLCNERGSAPWRTIYEAILNHWSKKGYRIISTRELINEYMEHERRFKIEFKYERD